MLGANFPTLSIQSPYLINTRVFPVNTNKLEPVLSKMYFDVAQAVNNRTIGIFNKFQIVTGERWFNSQDPTTQDFDISQQPQTYRQVYTFGAIIAGDPPAVSPHNIVNFTQFTRMYGTCITDFPDYRPIPYASVAANTNIDLRADTTNIYIAVGAGSPNVVSGIIVLEYLLN